MYSRRRRSEGSIDFENLYALDSYGRPVLCEYDLKEHKFQRRRRPAGLKSMLPLSDDQLTREEKAARIRAEIARRREELINSELSTRYRHPIDERILYPEQEVFPDDFEDAYDEYMDYEEAAYDQRNPAGMRPGHLRTGPAYLSRSLDTGFDEYAYDERAFVEDDFNARHRRG